MPDPDTSVVLLNEVLPVPRSVDWNGDGQVTRADAWLELSNTADGTVDLSGWHLEISNGEDGEDGDYLIPAGTSLRPAGFLVLYPLQKEMSLVEGGRIRLFDNEGKLVDQVILMELPADTGAGTDSALPRAIVVAGIQTARGQRVEERAILRPAAVVDQQHLELEAAGHDMQIEKVGEELRAMMPWIAAGKQSVKDTSGGQG